MTKVKLSLTDLMPVSVQVLYRPVVSGIIPALDLNDPSEEARSWWAEQIKRCRLGWVAPDGKYLNGMIYFYLNFCKIPILTEDSNTFRWDSPLYRDNDHDIFDLLWLNTYRQDIFGNPNYAKNHIEAKPRGIAWDSITVIGYGLYNFIFRNDNPIGFVASNNNDYALDSIKKWIQTAWDLLPFIFKTHNGHLLEMYSPNGAGSLFTYYNDENKKPVYVSKAHFDIIESPHKTGIYRGKKMNAICVLEAGMWESDSLISFFQENEPSVKLGEEQWGSIIIGGTSNAIINKSTAYRDMFFNADKYNATTHFTPKTKVLRGFIDYFTGKSNEAEALNYIVSQRELKRSNENAYNQELFENPLTPEEAFLCS